MREECLSQHFNDGNLPTIGSIRPCSNAQLILKSRLLARVTEKKLIYIAILLVVCFVTCELSTILDDNEKYAFIPNTRRQKQILNIKEFEGRLPHYLYESVTLPGGKGGCDEDRHAILDIYRSPDPQSTTILYLPGGAYLNHAGNPADFVAPGYTVAMLYYRLPRSHLNPEIVCHDPNVAMEDVKNAMRLLREKVEEYHVDPENIVTVGYSAGGHLAALHATTCTMGECPNAMVLHFPWLEDGSKVFCSDVGTSFMRDAVKVECFPTALVDKATPPTVLYHNSGDTIVPQKWISDFMVSLDNYNVPNRWFEIQGGGHYMMPYEAVTSAYQDLDPNLGFPAFAELALSMPRPTCSRCDDIPTPYMEVCTNNRLRWDPQTTCTSNPQWVSQGYCRKSCAIIGRGYNDVHCCADKETPTCHECMDAPSLKMFQEDKECRTHDNLPAKCRNDQMWSIHTYCRNSCFVAGVGYDGDNCCEKPQCTQCDDKITSYMKEMGSTCQKSRWALHHSCSFDHRWSMNRYCRKSCHSVARGYYGDNCCH